MRRFRRRALLGLLIAAVLVLAALGLVLDAGRRLGFRTGWETAVA
jgi:hypothetical protein